MPSQETAFHRQKAVLWPWVGVDGDNRAITGPPVELKVRWVTKRRQIFDPQGTPIGVDATVEVDRNIPIGSTMWHGSLNDWYALGSAGGNVSELLEVVTYNEASDIKNRHIARTVDLVFFRNKPATQV